MALIWYAPQATVKIGSALASISTTSTLFDQVTPSGPGDFTDTVKELRVRGAEADVDVLNLLGANQKFDERRPTLREIEFTRVFNKAQEWTDIMWNNVLGAPTGYTRTGGKDRTGARPKKAIAIKLTNGVNESNFLANNAVITRVERSLSAEGHMEETITVKCLVADWFEEFK
jgi:hypothetical protein